MSEDMNNHFIHIKHLLMAPFHPSGLLTCCILLASLDANGLLNYVLRAVLGGAIWLGFKLLAEYIQRKKNEKK
jgi:hypothetical protein